MWRLGSLEHSGVGVAVQRCMHSGVFYEAAPFEKFTMPKMQTFLHTKISQCTVAMMMKLSVETAQPLTVIKGCVGAPPQGGEESRERRGVGG